MHLDLNQIFLKVSARKHYLKRVIPYKLYGITSTLTAINFLHYRIAAKMALEILG